MAPLLIADGSLPPPLVRIPEVLLARVDSSHPLINSDQDLLTVVGTLATDPNGPVWSEWSQSCTLLTDASCTPYPELRSLPYIHTTTLVGLFCNFATITS